MRYTDNYRFLKPAQSDYYNIDDQNENMDKIEGELLNVRNELAIGDDNVKKWTAKTFSNPNLLINGDFQVWQRGISFSSGGYTADRWCVTDYSKGQSNNITYSDDIPSGTSGMSAKIDIRSLGDEFIFGQLLENELVAGNTYTLSSWVKGPTGAIIQMAFMDISQTYTMTGDWQYLTITSQLTEGQTNRIAPFRRPSITGKYYVKNVKLECGEVATPFVHRSYGEELALCQRYYVCSRLMGVMQYVSSDAVYFFVPLPVTTRINTPSLYNIAFDVYSQPQNAKQTGFTLSVMSDEGKSKNGVFVRAAKAAHGLTNAYLNIYEGGFDAEIY